MSRIVAVRSRVWIAEWLRGLWYGREWRARRKWLRKELERQLEKKAETLRRDMWDVLRKTGYV